MLADILIGGACTLAGGFGGAWFLTWLEGRRESERATKDLNAALLVVAHELTENVAWLDIKLKAPDGATAIPLDESSYRRVQLTLAKELPGPLAHDLGLAYSLVVAAEQHIQDGIRRGGLSDAEVKALTGARDRMALMRDQLIELRLAPAKKHG